MLVSIASSSAEVLVRSPPKSCICMINIIFIGLKHLKIWFDFESKIIVHDLQGVWQSTDLAELCVVYASKELEAETPEVPAPMLL